MGMNGICQTWEHAYQMNKTESAMTQMLGIGVLWVESIDQMFSSRVIGRESSVRE